MKTIGYIMFGEYRLFGVNVDVEKYAEENEIDKEKLKSAYEKLTMLSLEKLL